MQQWMQLLRQLPGGVCWRLVLWLAGGAVCALMTGCGTLYATAGNGQGQQVMLLGFDPVAYFTEGKPVRGERKHQVTTNDGVTYYFASRNHQSLFVSSPQRYEPQYGGFCAKGAAYGMKAGSDPTAWEIHDGRLFIFSSEYSRQLWLMDRDLNVKRADEYWPQMRGVGWRVLTLARLVFRVPHYKSTRELEEEWQSRNPGKVLPKSDFGYPQENLLFTPGWRAAQGRGQPALGWPD